MSFVGPELPSHLINPKNSENDESSEKGSDSDDDEFGPKPLPAGMQHQQTDAVKEFIEREEKRRKLAEVYKILIYNLIYLFMPCFSFRLWTGRCQTQEPSTRRMDACPTIFVKSSREWVLIVCTFVSCNLFLIDLDPTKLKARQFSRGSGPVNSKPDNSLWTETPAERQQRLADEVSGKKRRVTDAPVDEDTTGANKRRKQDEERIKKNVDEYTVRFSFLSPIFASYLKNHNHLAKT